MAPLVWLAGIPWGEAQAAGALMGTKTVLNELVAYLDLARLPKGELSERSVVIMTYALCGFANFGSLGILIGGLGTMVPERRVEIVALGPKSILSGTLATLLTGRRRHTLVLSVCADARPCWRPSLVSGYSWWDTS
jgi:concentrative nucleoside transporter, CNT family